MYRNRTHLITYCPEAQISFLESVEPDSEMRPILGNLAARIGFASVSPLLVSSPVLQS